MLQQQNSRKIIYHADDDEDDRLLFMDAVSELDLDINVVQAEDGHQLLNTLYQAVLPIPEMLFLDINMPGKNGLECLKEIKNTGGAFNDLRVIMLSTSSSDYSIDTSYQLGADFYAVKPGSYQELKKLLLDIFMTDWKIFTRSKAEFLLV